MRLTLYEATTRETRPDHNTGEIRALLCEKCVGFLTPPANLYRENAGHGPTVYRPYPRRLERLTI